jgi:PAS domain S-box-containing protein
VEREDSLVEQIVFRNTFEDVTEHKHALDALTESDDKWRGLVEHAPMSIFIITNKQFSYLNPAAVELFEVQSEDDILDKPMIDRVHQDCHDSTVKRFATVINKRKPVPAIDEKWLRLDGTLFELVVSAAPIVYKGQDSALIFAREKL